MGETVSRYRKLFPRLWRHPGFTAMPKSSAVLCLYLLTGPQTNRIGCFHFSPATAAEDLGVTVETIRKGLADVAGAFGWMFDADARLVYIPSWWRWNAPENCNVLVGNLKDLNELAPSALVEAFARNVETLPETFHQTFIEGCQKRLRKGPPIQEQEQFQKQKQKQEHTRAARVPEGVDGEGAQLVPIAREVLQSTSTALGADHLVDVFQLIARKDNRVVSRKDAARAIAVALSERRTA